jgi:uncharacterized Zn finger protein
MNKTLILKCPSCKNNMKYASLKKEISKCRKRCVYCGKTFKILGNILK